jgi:hypothetical protein
MKINERILKRLFGLIQNKYPYIIDMDYEYDEDYNPFVNSDIHNFKLYVDLDMIHEILPEYTFDLKFINGHMNPHGCVNVTEMFNEFAEDEDCFMYGIGVNVFIDSLIYSVMRPDESFGYKFHIG